MYFERVRELASHRSTSPTKTIARGMLERGHVTSVIKTIAAGAEALQGVAIESVGAIPERMFSEVNQCRGNYQRTRVKALQRTYLHSI